MQGLEMQGLEMQGLEMQGMQHARDWGAAARGPAYRWASHPGKSNKAARPQAEVSIRSPS